jgi:hypothetical protein
MAGERYMYAGSTATAVQDSPRPGDETEDMARHDVTLVVPAVPMRVEPETRPSEDPRAPQTTRDPVTRQQPAVNSEPTTQEVPTDDGSNRPE